MTFHKFGTDVLVCLIPTKSAVVELPCESTHLCEVGAVVSEGLPSRLALAYQLPYVAAGGILLASWPTDNELLTQSS